MEIYGLELLELGIDLGLDEVENVGNAVVLSGKSLVFLEGVDSQKGDKDAGKNNSLHCDISNRNKTDGPELLLYDPIKIIRHSSATKEVILTPPKKSAKQ